MRPSRRCSHHLDRLTSFGDIGSSFDSGPCIDDDYTPMIVKEKFQPPPAIVKPSRTTKTGSKDSTLAEGSTATRPSQDPSQPSRNPGFHLKQAALAVAELLSRVSTANSVSEEEEQSPTRPRPPMTKGIFSIGSPERELSAAIKIDDSDELGLFGEFIKKCTSCKKEFKPGEDVYMYNDHPFCSSNCHDDGSL